MWAIPKNKATIMIKIIAFRESKMSRLSDGFHNDLKKCENDVL